MDGIRYIARNGKIGTEPGRVEDGFHHNCPASILGVQREQAIAIYRPRAFWTDDLLTRRCATSRAVICRISPLDQAGQTNAWRTRIGNRVAGIRVPEFERHDTYAAADIVEASCTTAQCRRLSATPWRKEDSKHSTQMVTLRPKRMAREIGLL